MKYRNIPHLIESIYLNDSVTPFHVNEVSDSKSKSLYINDPRYLKDVNKYVSLGLDVTSRFNYPGVTYIPYDLNKDIKIDHWSNVFKSELPIFLCNYENLRISYLEDTLAILTPPYIGNLTYKGDLTFLGLINNYLNKN